MKRILVAAALSVSAAAAQPRPAGVVISIDAERRLTLKTDDGHELLVIPEENTSYLRVRPGAKDLSGAAKISATEVAAGDRVLARGKLSEDQKTVSAVSILVMSKADVARQNDAERAAWQRGISGIVKSIDAAAREIVVTSRGTEVKVALGSAVLKRYAPDSVRFADAQPSDFGALRAGDQIRARGTPGPGGQSFTAEEMVSGAFRNIAAQVVSVDAAANTAQVKDLDTRKTLTLRITPDSALRRLPAFAAQMLALRNVGGAGRGTEPGGGPPAGARPEGPPLGGGRPGGFAGARGNPGDLLERAPAFQFGELKPGDALIVAATQSNDPGRITAITVLAGVEPILSAAPPGGRQTALGNWNLDLNMNMGPM